MRWEVVNVVDKIFKKNLHNSKNEQKIKSTVTKLKNKIKKSDIIVTKADKGNTMVLMRKEEYIKKPEEFIREGPVSYTHLDVYKRQMLYFVPNSYFSSSTLLTSFDNL